MKTKEEAKNRGLSTAGGIDIPAVPAVVERTTFQAELDAPRVQEKASVTRWFVSINSKKNEGQRTGSLFSMR